MLTKTGLGIGTIPPGKSALLSRKKEMTRKLNISRKT